MSDIQTSIAPVVKVGDTLAGEFETLSKVNCDSLTLKISPHMSIAQLSHKYGRVSFAPGAGFIDELSLDLSGKFVDIYIGDDSAFIGMIIPQIDRPLGTKPRVDSTDLATGNNIYTAYSLDFLLDKVYIDKSFTKNHGTVNTLFKFNGNSAAVFQKNRSAAKVGDSYLFDFTGDGGIWSGLDIIEYVLANFSDETGDNWEFSTNSQHAYLAKITAAVDPQGKTIRQILNEIIAPNNGFSWRTVLENDEPKVYVFSIVDEAIVDGAEIMLPANPATASITNLIEYGRTIGGVNISQLQDSAYDYVRVTSEPVRVMATFDVSKSGAGLNRDWTDSLESSYNSSAVTDRATDDYDKLFAAWKFPPTWDKKDVSSQSVAAFVDEETLEVTFPTDAPFCFPAHVLDRSLPLKKDEDTTKEEFRPPIFFVYDDDETSYFIANKVARTENSETSNIGLSVNDDSPGFTLGTPWQHICGKGIFSGTSDYGALYDYVKCLITASFYTDGILAYKIAGAETAGTNRTKTINIPGMHYWVGLNGTRIGEGEQLAEFTVYRDDREAIKRLANLAAAWYGRVRNTVTFTNQRLTYVDIIGKMITSVYSGGNFIPVGTIMSNVVYDFIANTVTYATEYADVDFSKISRRSMISTEKATATRLARIEENIKNIPNRTTEGPGGGSGGAAISWGKVTTITNANNYIINVYNRSNETTPLKAEQSCRVFDITTVLSLNDWLPVQVSNIESVDYESVQQLGLL